MKKLFLFLLFISAFNLNAGDKKIEVGVDEKLGDKLPLNLQFVNESGQLIPLRDLITKPTIIVFVYYECPGICTPLMTSLAETADESDMKPGVDYNIISISFNENDNYKLAAEKKRNYMKMMQRNDFPESAWHFLTADSLTIQKVTNAAGFYFKRVGKDFIHTGTLIFTNKDGMITRYLFPSYNQNNAYRILPFDFKMAVIETSENKLIPTPANMLQLCFRYDPEGKTYVLNLTRIFGSGIILAALIFIIIVVKKPKKAKNKKENL